VAELLIVSNDRPVPDSPGKWREGETVIVRPDGWQWGREELNTDKFVILSIPDAVVEDVLDFQHEDWDTPGDPETPMHHRRRFVIPSGLMSALKNAPAGRLERALATVLAQREDRVSARG
jgi:hypothetical protein